MEEELYDEFGNLIGDPLDSDAESEVEYGSDSDDSGSRSDATSEEEDDEPEKADENGPEDSMDVDEPSALTTTSLSSTFPDTQTIIAHPYDQARDEPVLKPETKKKVKVDFTDSIRNENEEASDELISDKLPELTYSREYMINTMNALPERIRNIAVVGGLHSGKTSLIDTLVVETHNITLGTTLKSTKPLRYTDNHKLEIDRQMSLKLTPISLLLADISGKSHVLNLIDCPGHPNFMDETIAALQAVDGAILVVDVVEGLTPSAKAIITEVISRNLPLTVAINKIDRLILELQLTPADAYYKIKYILDDINYYISENEYVFGYNWPTTMSPRLNNVIFAASAQLVSFTTKSFANLYYSSLDFQSIEFDRFTAALWGDIYYNPTTRKFSKSSDGGNLPRSFVHFVMEPLYKLFTYSLTSDSTDSKALSTLLWDNFNISLHKLYYKKDPQVLLREVLLRVLGGSRGLVDLLVSSVVPPSGSSDQLEAIITKLSETTDAESFYAVVRVVLGTLRVGSKIKVLGENYQQDEDDSKIETVDEIFLPGGRYRVPIQRAGPGSIVLVSGIDSIVTKAASICSVDNKQPTPRNKFHYGAKSVFKVAIEPEIPAELPKLLDGFRKLNKSYLSLEIKVEESGEHVLLAPGELYLDCVLHDLRKFFTDDLDIKVSDPMTRFAETCDETSVTKIPVATPSKRCEISIIAEPMDAKVGRAIESGKISLSQPTKTTAKILRNEFGWDALAARSLWSFGPEDIKFPSILLDDTLEGETDKEALYSVKDFINTGFNLGINEGPLCEEPIRNTKFRILDAVLSGSGVQKSGSQIIPMTRNAVHTGILTATPRLLEPVYRIVTTSKYVAIGAVEIIVKKRRGRITKNFPVPGTDLYEVEGYVPVIESVGLETDIRLQTQGQAMCFLEFDRWSKVPGDPLDSECFLPTLKPVPRASLARDFVMKTRRRKGLSGEPSLQKYIDPDLYDKLKESGVIS